MGMFDEIDEERELDDLKLRISRTIGKKSDRGIEKGIITQEEAKKLDKAIEKLMKKQTADWWELEKGQKSYDIAMDLLKEAELGTYAEEIEILTKIEKA